MVLVKVKKFNAANFIGLFNFEWHSQNQVGNVAILVLWTDCKNAGTFLAELAE